MDLTKTYPRSVKDRLAGVVMLARTTDKARAYGKDTLGEYHYNCPMDRAVFSLLGIDHEEFARQAAALDDEALARWVGQNFVTKKQPREIEQFNESFLRYAPEPGSESEKYFFDLRNRLDASRTDITSWADLLDLDEGRVVPLRKAA